MKQQLASCANIYPRDSEIVKTGFHPAFAVVRVICSQPDCNEEVELPEFVTMLNSHVRSQFVFAKMFELQDFKPGGRLHNCRSVCQECGTSIGITLENANYILRETARRANTESEGLTWVINEAKV